MLITSIDPGLEHTGVCQYCTKSLKIVNAGLFSMKAGYEVRADKSITLYEYVCKRVYFIASHEAIFRSANEIRIEFQFKGLYNITIKTAFTTAFNSLKIPVKVFHIASLHKQFPEVFYKYGAGNPENKKLSQQGAEERITNNEARIVADAARSFSGSRKMKKDQRNHIYDAYWFCLFDSAKKSPSGDYSTSTTTNTITTKSKSRKRKKNRKSNTGDDNDINFELSAEEDEYEYEYEDEGKEVQLTARRTRPRRRRISLRDRKDKGDGNENGNGKRNNTEDRKKFKQTQFKKLNLHKSIAISSLSTRNAITSTTTTTTTTNNNGDDPRNSIIVIDLTTTATPSNTNNKK